LLRFISLSRPEGYLGISQPNRNACATCINPLATQPIALNIDPHGELDLKSLPLILIGIVILAIGMVLHRVSLDYWVGGAGSENFRRGMRRFNQIWFITLGLLFIGGGVWLLLKR